MITKIPRLQKDWHLVLSQETTAMGWLKSTQTLLGSQWIQLPDQPFWSPVAAQLLWLIELFGKLRRLSLAGEAVSHGLRLWGFKSSCHVQLDLLPFTPPLTCALVHVDQMWALSYSPSKMLPACSHALCHDGHGLTLWDCKANSLSYKLP